MKTDLGPLSGPYSDTHSVVVASYLEHVSQRPSGATAHLSLAQGSRRAERGRDPPAVGVEGKDPHWSPRHEARPSDSRGGGHFTEKVLEPIQGLCVALSFPQHLRLRTGHEGTGCWLRLGLQLGSPPPHRGRRCWVCTHGWVSRSVGPCAGRGRECMPGRWGLTLPGGGSPEGTMGRPEE